MSRRPAASPFGMPMRLVTGRSPRSDAGCTVMSTMETSASGVVWMRKRTESLDRSTSTPVIA